MKAKLFSKIAKAALTFAAASLVSVLASCSDASVDYSKDYAVISAMNAGTDSVEAVSEVSSDSRSLTMP